MSRDALSCQRDSDLDRMFQFLSLRAKNVLDQTIMYLDMRNEVRKARTDCARALWPSLQLAAETQFLDQLAVLGRIFPVDVLQMAAALAHQLEQAAAAVLVVLVGLEVLGELLDPGREDRDLYLRRTGITLVPRIRLDDFFFDLFVDSHSVLIAFSI